MSNLKEAVKRKLRKQAGIPGLLAKGVGAAVKSPYTLARTAYKYPRSTALAGIGGLGGIAAMEEGGGLKSFGKGALSSAADVGVYSSSRIPGLAQIGYGIGDPVGKMGLRPPAPLPTMTPMHEL
jgi:hypothetical protein